MTQIIKANLHRFIVGAQLIAPCIARISTHFKPVYQIQNGTIYQGLTNQVVMKLGVINHAPTGNMKLCFVGAQLIAPCISGIFIHYKTVYHMQIGVVCQGMTNQAVIKLGVMNHAPTGNMKLCFVGAQLIAPCIPRIFTYYKIVKMQIGVIYQGAANRDVMKSGVINHAPTWGRTLAAK